MTDDLLHEYQRYLPTFVVAADELNFSAAARRIGVTPAAVSKAVRTLEAGLGVRLFHRTTRVLTLTDDGARLHQMTAPLQLQLSEALSEVRNQHQEPRGRLRITAPRAIGREHVIPVVERFVVEYPEVHFDLHFGDRVVDLVGERFDLAIGVRPETLDTVIARKLYESRTVVIAAPALLREHGTPDHPNALRDRPCIGFRSPSVGTLFPWAFRDPSTGAPFTVNLRPHLTAASVEDLCELCARGLGFTLAGHTTARPHIESGAVTTVLDDFAATIDVMVYYSSRDNLPTRVRLFLDALIEHTSGSGGGDRSL